MKYTTMEDLYADKFLSHCELRPNVYAGKYVAVVESVEDYVHFRSVTHEERREILKNSEKAKKVIYIAEHQENYCDIDDNILCRYFATTEEVAQELANHLGLKECTIARAFLAGDPILKVKNKKSNTRKKKKEPVVEVEAEKEM